MKKAWLFIFCLYCLSWFPGPGRCAGEAGAAGSGAVHVIPVRDNIEGALLYVIRRGIREAEKEKAAAIIFEMDTNGGELPATEEIVRILLRTDIPTYTFINTKAFSAGAIIALGTDYIYMAPGSVIGAATPVMVSPFSGPQEMPHATQEKISSGVAALIRSVAQEKGHDPELAEAMVRSDFEYKVGDTIISKDGQLLTLTNIEAEQYVDYGEGKRRLLSQGTVANVDEILEITGMSGLTKKEFEVSTVEKIARVIKSVSVLLLAGGLLGIYIEARTPGIGLPGILGVTLLFIFFWGHHIAGLAGMEEVILFFIGAVLLLLEIFVIPGFGLTGIIGIALIVVSIVAAMMPRIPLFSPSLAPGLFTGSLYDAMRVLAFSVVVAGTCAWGLSKLLPKNRGFCKIILEEVQDRSKGFQSHDDFEQMLGMEGVTLTGLRPGGVAMLGDRRVDVTARGDFIEQSVPVRVVDVKGAVLFVEPV